MITKNEIADHELEQLHKGFVSYTYTPDPWPHSGTRKSVDIEISD
jgi:hypothetical protein